MASALMDGARAAAQPRSRVAARTVDGVIQGRLIATFVRELGGVVPASRADDSDAYRELEAYGRPLCVELPATKRQLLTALARPSPTGHHEFAGPIIFKDSSGERRPLAGPFELADVLVGEMAAREGHGPDLEHRQLLLRADMRRSIENTRAFAETRQTADPWSSARGVRRFIAAEQSLVFGHPFHPAPKSGDLSGRGGAEPYRPELGARFQLEYFALAPELLLEDALGDAVLICPEARRAAARELPAGAAHWPLLPVHPWQAERVRERPQVAELIGKGQLIPLGRQGEPVSPTSSVRTVYAPEQDLFIKLPLDARITNFVRNNPLEHLERSLTASRVLARISERGGVEPLVILPELGYRGLRLTAETGGEELAASFAVLFRRGLRRKEQALPVVVAALLEPSSPGSDAPITEVLWSAARAAGRPVTAALVGDWVARYAEVALVPILSLFARYGVSLEAHVQNSLIGLDDGWPRRLVVRDLEGTSLGRARALRERALLDLVPETSGIWVEDDEAWQRLLYYVIVNHFAHLLATLAAHGPAEEWQLWQVVRGVLQDAVVLREGQGARCVEELLNRPELPAKANWVSCLRGSSEKPSYVMIANPLAEDESCT